MKFLDTLPQSKPGRILLLAVLLQAVLVIALESYLAGVFLARADDIENTRAKGIPVYLLIFVFSQVFQVVLCWDAVWHQNSIQLLGFVLFNACTFAYSLFQVEQLNGALSDPTFSAYFAGQQLMPAMISISAILGVTLIGFTYLSWKLFLEFGWRIYKKIGADPEMKSMYRTYQVFLMVLKLDFFFFLAFAVQFLVLVLRTQDAEFALTIFAIPATVVVLLFAVYGVRQENRAVMLSFMFGCLLAMAYFTFKLVRMYQPDQAAKYEHSRRFLTFFAGLSLFMTVITLINSIMCYLNFGKGLRQHISMGDDGGARPASPGGEGHKMTLV